MQYYEVAPTKVIRADQAVFTYAYEGELSCGQLVVVEVGRSQITGVVIRSVSKPTFATKTITSLIDKQPLPKQLVELASWMADYYASHLALVLQTMLPRGLQKTRRNRKTEFSEPIRNRTKFVLNEQQSEAVRSIRAANPGTVLLHGITGSGKTAVYVELSREAIAKGKSVVVLVPEIALTTQLVDEFRAHINDIIITHSRQTEATRHMSWLGALHAEKPQVIIGPRSALFLPLKDIGLIIIDESHEPSFKQEQTPRYSALRAAGVLARLHKATLVMGSATPLVSDYYLAKHADALVEMRSTARISKPPRVELIDMTNRAHFKRHRFLSDKLLDKIEQTLGSNEQVLLFHNRRGSAPTTLCQNCGWLASCPRCFIPLTLHTDTHLLQCHVCAHRERVPTSCPSCGGANIIHKGIGTKLVETELQKLFPAATIGRFDADNDTEGVDTAYKQLYDGDIDIIIGTQVIAKGLDLPHLTTVGVIQADAGLSLPDFGTSERTFQLLTQAIGRVGRNDRDTSVVVQSYQPSHPAITDSLTQNYIDFYHKTLADRKRANFPPYVFILKLTCIYKTEAATIRNSQQFASSLRRKYRDGVEILGPTPAFYERQRDSYRWQLVIKAKKRATLIDVVADLPPSHWQFELDPTSLL